MKCNNCGNMNNPGRLRCEACNAELKGSVVAPLEARKKQSAGGLKCKNCNFLNAAGSIRCAHCNAPMLGSVADAPAPPQPKPAPRPAELANATRELGGKTQSCPHCSYPNLPSAETCARCSQPLAGAAPPVQAAPKPEEPGKGKPAIEGTINPWSKPAAQVPRFRLRPLTRPGEAPPGQLEFQGSQVTLNRENLEPANRTITSQTQATVEHRDGAWVLSNGSAQKTTFLLVKADTPLRKGDIILMGDRMFEFDC